MRNRVSIWTVANEAVWAHGSRAPAVIARRAEALRAKGDHADAVALRLLADACETLLSELPVAGRKAS